MKKFEQPIVKVTKFEAKDVIATSANVAQARKFGAESLTNSGSAWE